jgi:flagellar protein FlaI
MSGQKKGPTDSSAEEAEKKAKQAAEARMRAEERARKEAEERSKKEAKEREREAGAARKEAERKEREQARIQREQEEQRKKDAESARKTAEQKARTERHQKEQEEKARLKAAEEARVAAERKAREEIRVRKIEEERARVAAEKARREAERAAAVEARRKIRDEREKVKLEELARKDKERRDRAFAEQQRREEERAAKERERTARIEAVEARKKELAQKKDMELKAREEERLRRAQEKARGRKAPEPAGGPKVPLERILAPERQRQQKEISNVLAKIKLRFPMTGTPIPPAWRTMERYPVNSPFAYTVIAQSPLGAKRYFLDEVPLTKTEAGIYSYLLDALEDELTVPRTEVNPRQFFADQARKILLKYSIIIPSTSWAKIIYFAERDLVGFGVIDGLMRDPNIEDISIDAVNKPLFIYHKGHESLETNITLTDDDDLDNLVTRLSHMAGKHVSTAFPIVQGTLPGRHRLVATFRREVSPQGSTATIRKFREDPLTIIDMLNLGVLDHRMAAYIWLMMQNRATGIVVGATGAGKTTLLNALITLTRLNTKVVTIEEVQEINISHLNWTSLVSRESYAVTEDKAGSVDLFELVKAAMRMRPDILVVGEVRGEEAYVLFQAISTGHGGICTLHADDTASALQRLTSEPMNVPPAFIPFLDLSFVIRRLSVPTASGGFRSIRKIVSVDEVINERESNQVFRYEPSTDTFLGPPLEKSLKIRNIAEEQGLPISSLIGEIERRSVVLKWLQQRGIRNFREISPILELFASKPEETYGRAVSELQAAGVPLPGVRGDGSK